MMTQRAAGWLIALGLVLAPQQASAVDPWHKAGWQARAIVDIPTPSADKGVDTAGVRILCQGRAKPDGSDYRVVDAGGKAVPFQIQFHDHERYSLLSFRADNPKQRYFVYFGNPQAQRAEEEVRVNPAPGSGQPLGAWVPKYGLVLQTMERPEGDNPKSVADMAKLMAGSKRKFGGRFQRRVADGYNGFGPSDYYISVYRGWISIPTAGKYSFCTASNEASFSFLDGRPLVHWPGRHTAERGMFGEVNAEVCADRRIALPRVLPRGSHPRTDGLPGLEAARARGFIAIPESLYTAPHTAVVTSYESPKGPLLTFEPIITDSIWPASRSEGQYTRCRIKITPEAGTSYRWDCGDGQTPTGAEVEHVYLTLGDRVVTLTAQGPAGTQTARWPLQVFEIEHVTDLFREGRPPDYAKLAKTYDRAKLDAPALKELAMLFAESEQPADALEVGKAFVQRFPTARPLEMARVRRVMADSALRLGQGSVDEAVANYQAALVKELPTHEKVDLLARLIRLVGLERNQPEKAAPLLKQVEETIASSKKDAHEDELQAAYRRAIIAMGDVRLWQGNRDGARELYGRAERLKGYIPPQVRAVRIGSYPNSIREYLALGNYGAALDIVDQWDETFPTEKPNGHTFFYRGKVLALRGQPREAGRYLERGIRLTVGASFETEARFAYAECLEKLDRKDDARKELERLVATGLNDDWTKQAKEKLRKK